MMNNSARTWIWLLLAWTASLPLRAANPHFVVGYVWSSVGTPGSQSTANSYAGVTLVRNGIPGEPAIQMAGSDPSYPSRIFPALGGKPAYYATDAGSQWVTPLSAGWTILSVVETAPGKHGWNGDAYASAVRQTVGSDDMTRARITMPHSYPALIPRPVLDTASNSKIALKIGYFEDAGGLAKSMAVFRRAQGESTFSWLANAPLAALGSTTTYEDASVEAGKSYEYATAVNFDWPGGKGAGGLPGSDGIFSTTARAVAGPFWAAAAQPTPTVPPTSEPEKEPELPLPEGWLAYPNPATGKALFVSISADKTSDFRISAYNLVGERVLVQSGRLQDRGTHKVALPIGKLASGIYFFYATLTDENGNERELPSQKIAVLH